MVPIFRPCSCGELHQVGQARHRAVVLDDLADHRGGRQARQRREIAAGLGVAGAHQHAAGLGHDREHVARLDDVLGPRVVRDGGEDRAGAVGRRNARGDAFGRFDADGERRAVLGAVAVGHQRQVQQLAAFLGERQADEAAAVAGHEVDRFRRDEFGGDHEVALVFAVFFVDEYHHPAGFQFGDDLKCGGERHGGENFGKARILRHARVRVVAPNGIGRLAGWRQAALGRTDRNIALAGLR